MTLQQTSLSAYESISPNLGEMQWEVYNALKDLGVANNKILSLKLGWDINRVTPRVNELVKANLVIEDSKRPDPKTKRMTIFWRVR